MLTKEKAQQYLKDSLQNQSVDFKEDQFKAIDSVVNQRKKVLVVQKTGWGKSIVYFIATKYLREEGYGLTIIISPLLALMRNQIDSAKKLGLNVVTINSSNTYDWNIIKYQILQNKVDALLVSPERLANESFMHDVIEPIASKIGLFVIDEAHCISDWGHDFRPDYKRITSILRQIPSNTPILATTATANDRVITDIENQINGLITIRGNLRRESLSLHTIRLPEPSHRLAWLIEHIPTFNGSGIVYVLTQRDARVVSQWLNQNGINSSAYYSGVEDDSFANGDEYRVFLENQLLENKIKVLVATSALGMGFDKSDLGFVVHYQAPGSIISYYQQVGRAGRGIDEAYGVLLSGHEDDNIHDFFRGSSFPKEENINIVLNQLEKSNGLSIIELQKELNITQGEVEKTLKYLNVESPAPVVKIGNKWNRTPNKYVYNKEKVQAILNIRLSEWEEMQKYLDTNECLMMFLQKALNDPYPQACGKCGNCVMALSGEFSHENGLKAADFLKKSDIVFSPKKQVKPDALLIYGIRGNIKEELRADEGRILSRWEDSGWGRVVANNKHYGEFSDQLVDAFVEMIKNWNPIPSPAWVTCVPSLNHITLVPNFANKVAKKLNLPFIEAVKKIRHNQPQKMMNNSYHQAKNLDGVFDIIDKIPSGAVLLIDDVIDSGWTVTVISALLKRKGSGNIFPASLSTTGKM
ncbi:RecQ family ATP-dependent DNA helicase [Arcobacter caeni]|uniref:DNA 3'-5' helicase n=1 Tax=Arcobacter caeni TaxID=1912877 RepID=A0A363D5L4_9BACT|nr:RecQ family ATP-dependent DNA helicase [Arcobacter caeni]PUE66628.1 ATP-dependent DNA helicase RecG [Arcobacter caeni]